MDFLRFERTILVATMDSYIDGYNCANVSDISKYIKIL